MRLRISFSLTLIAALLAAASTAIEPRLAPAAAAAPGAERTGDVIVHFRQDAPLAGVAGALDSADVTATSGAAGSGVVLVEPEAGQSVDDAIDALAGDPNVLFAEPDLKVSLALTPNDPYYACPAPPAAQTCQWHYPQINLPAAWDITTGSSSVIIAVLDTGVMLTHPDLDGKITSGANAGYDFHNDDSNPTDDHGHGTFVAGIAAAESNNGQWVAGVCWACKIMPVKVLGADGQGSTYNVAAGIDWARTQGADVINLSLGGTATNATLENAVNAAWNAGIVVVAATGNDNGPVYYPAAYANALAVGSNDINGARSSFSNYGASIDVMAPGESVVSTILGGGYGMGSGTSFAAPHVAGLAALIISAGVTDHEEVVSLIKTTATDMGTAGFDNLTGWGRVNAAAAVAGSDTTPPTVSITSPSSGATVSGTIQITATASDASGIEKVRFWAGPTYLGFDTTSPYSMPWNTTIGLNGRAWIKAEAIDNFGNATVTSRLVTVINPDSTPPTVAISSPSNGATVTGNVTIAATASDTQGVQKVQFWAGSSYLGFDTTAPYTKTWNTGVVPAGTHIIRARAVDWGNNTTETTITVTVAHDDTTPPTVAISMPADGAEVSGSISIVALATDNVGVQKVQFWVDSTYLGFDATAPYARTWDSTAVPNGPHTIRVRSVDWANNVSTNAIITVNVNN
jgi:subtilisin family serine protease